MKKIVIVTGAGKGIGYHSALRFAAEGCYVIAISRNEASLKKLKSESPEISILPLDLSGSLLPLGELLSENGISHVDVLINNAGLLINKKFTEVTSSDLIATYEVNVFAPYRLIQLLLPQLLLSSKAHVVNISSMGGFQGVQKFPGLSAYSSSKAALVSLTECLAEELKDTSVKFNCLCLGATQTEMLEAAFPGYQAPVTASDMADFITDFALKNHHFMNGKIIPVALSTP